MKILHAIKRGLHAVAEVWKIPLRPGAKIPLMAILFLSLAGMAHADTLWELLSTDFPYNMPQVSGPTADTLTSYFGLWQEVDINASGTAVYIYNGNGSYSWGTTQTISWGYVNGHDNGNPRIYCLANSGFTKYFYIYQPQNYNGYDRWYIYTEEGSILMGGYITVPSDGDAISCSFTHSGSNTYTAIALTVNGGNKIVGALPYDSARYGSAGFGVNSGESNKAPNFNRGLKVEGAIASTFTFTPTITLTPTPTPTVTPTVTVTSTPMILNPLYMPNVSACFDTSRLYLGNTNLPVARVLSYASGNTIDVYSILASTTVNAYMTGNTYSAWTNASGDTLTVLRIYDQKNWGQYFYVGVAGTAPQLIFSATPGGKAVIKFAHSAANWFMSTPGETLSNLLMHGGNSTTACSTFYSAQPQGTPVVVDPDEPFWWTTHELYGEESGGRHFGVHHGNGGDSTSYMIDGIGNLDPTERAVLAPLDNWFYGGFDYDYRTWFDPGGGTTQTTYALSAYLNGEINGITQAQTDLHYVSNYTLNLGGAGLSSPNSFFEGLWQGMIICDAVPDTTTALNRARNMFNYYASDINCTATVTPTPTITPTLTITPTPNLALRHNLRKWVKTNYYGW